jgi:hypothetical protein
MIMGETGDSGHNPVLDGSAKNAICPNESRGDVKVTSQIEE